MQKYPLDFDNLNKGDTIYQSRLEDILQMDSSNPRYNLKVLRLCKHIEFQMRSRGKPVTVCQRLGDLVVLDDVSASTYNYRAVNIGIRRISRGYQRLIEVNQKNLNYDQRVVHIRRLENTSKVIQSLSQCAKIINQECKKRNL